MFTVAPVAVEKCNFNALYVPHLLKDQHEGLGKIQEDLKLSLVLIFFFLNVKLYQLHAFASWITEAQAFICSCASRDCPFLRCSTAYFCE